MAIDTGKTEISNTDGETNVYYYDDHYIPDSEFSQNTDIYKVDSYAQTIGSYTFLNCFNLTEINFKVTTEIERQAFQGCRLIKTINMPYLVKINFQAFGYCTKFDVVTLPNVEWIDNNGFYFNSVTSIFLPKANFIGNYTFQYCGNLRNIYINCEAESFQDLAFGVEGKRTEDLIIHTNADVMDTYTPETLIRIGAPNAIVKEWI